MKCFVVVLLAAWRDRAAASCGCATQAIAPLLTWTLLEQRFAHVSIPACGTLSP
jgi:hypothetical protein